MEMPHASALPARLELAGVGQTFAWIFLCICGLGMALISGAAAFLPRRFLAWLLLPS
jgi:hypothetical protein